MGTLNWIPPRIHNLDSMICAEAINIARRPADYTSGQRSRARAILRFWAKGAPAKSYAELLEWHRDNIKESVT